MPRATYVFNQSDIRKLFAEFISADMDRNIREHDVRVTQVDSENLTITSDKNGGIPIVMTVVAELRKEE